MAYTILQVKFIVYFQRNQTISTDLKSLAVRIGVTQLQSEQIAKHLVALSIIEQHDHNGAIMYRYKEPLIMVTDCSETGSNHL